MLLFIMLSNTQEAFSAEAKKTSLWRFIFPPKDLFDLVVKKEIDVTTTKTVEIGMFKLKYDGPYAVGVMLDGFSSDDYFTKPQNKYDLKLKIRIDVYEGGQLRCSRLTTSEYTPFLGRRGNGFWLTDFYAPADVPIRKDLTCKITVLSPDEVLSEKFGPVSVYIQKASEK